MKRLNLILACLLVLVVKDEQSVQAQDIPVGELPSVEHSKKMLNGWVSFEKDQIAFCAASLRNLINTEDPHGHIQSVAMVTMDTAVSSAVPLEDELIKYERRGHDLIADGQLVIAHNQFNTASWRRLGKKLLLSTYVTKVIFYPQRTERATVDNPSRTRHDLAVIKFHTVTPPHQLCRCHINFLKASHYFPEGYVVRITGHSGRMPTETASNFALGAYAEVRQCSDIAKYWGRFFCLKTRADEKGWPFGPDSGAPVLDLNLTVIGFGSFAFRVKDDVPSKGTLLAYVTDVSYVPYRMWLMKEVYGVEVTFNDTDSYDTERTRLSDCGQWSDFKWEDTTNYYYWNEYRKVKVSG